MVESKRRKTIGTKEIEDVVAKIARIPPKNVNKDDAEVLRDLEKNLKRVVFGQDPAIDALAAPSNWHAPACGNQKNPLATICLPVRQVLAKRKWPTSLLIR